MLIMVVLPMFSSQQLRANPNPIPISTCDEQHLQMYTVPLKPCTLVAMTMEVDTTCLIFVLQDANQHLE
jgi:hypothetical protein